MRAPNGTFTHGSSGYTNYQCRCEVCRKGWRDYMREKGWAREWNRKRRINDPTYPRSLHE